VFHDSCVLHLILNEHPAEPQDHWMVISIGFLFGNRLSGFLWAGLSLFTIIFFAILAYLKIEVPFMFPLKYLYWHFTICFFGVSVYILIIILIYDTINKNITNNIQIAHDDVVYKSFVIANQRNEILDSINYAKEIQQAILPSQQIIKQIFPQSFVLFKPKDIVSGDFYFFHQDFEHMYLAVADCTGHGVPGALLSMLGIAFLKDIISKNLHANSALILNELRIMIKSSLQQSGKSNTPQDGMDISFCSINVATLEMSFAGAYQPIWIFRNNNEMESDNECMKIKGDGMPIGVFHNETPFHEHKIQLQPNDNLYIFSDGYASQFNYDNSEKFGAKRLHALLNEICRYEIEFQYNNLVESLALWQGKTEQIDDILIIGVRIQDLAKVQT